MPHKVLSEYTPGPWHVRKVGYETLIGIGDDSFVAQVYIGNGKREANARLIAAAPDLLEACRKLVDYRSRNTTNWQLEKADDFISQMRAAIAKAEGSAQ